ncbi:hypothetical protein O6H91_15G037000 [Diphasiastrum complanatum]|uniref:Uncharacterized protein n=1 Tax=Diphasiastrum complanatum TaxID=34168 RepID=A0ACC2BHB8_DIPCM|nr:hypothetical protein O6H91_15G037000 [Diphasiastrum complanatum]
MIPFSKLSSISRTSTSLSLLSATPFQLLCFKAEGLKLAAASWRFMQTSDFTGTASQRSADSSSSPSWLDRIKGVFTGIKAPAPASQPVSDDAQAVPQESVFTMEAFADELKKARKLGSLTQFGKGLPRGGEATVSQSLLRQETILRALSKYDPQVESEQLISLEFDDVLCSLRINCLLS